MILSIENIHDKAKKIRYNIIKMVGIGNKGHIGGSCSIADIVTVLYFYKMKHDPKNPKWEDRDRFILSKGHAVIALYAALAECGYFPKKELDNFKKLGSMLQGHPDMLKTPGLEANTGSLGQGLSIACGIAAGLKLDNKTNKVYCAIGVGEVAKRQIWEAAMAASFYKLDNLVVILDRNFLSATGPIVECFNTNPLKEKWLAFGWHVIEIDGHNIKSIIEALDQADEVKKQPVIIIANTVKGKGISFAENEATYHNELLDKEKYKQACSELEK